MNKKFIFPVVMLFALCGCDKGNSNSDPMSLPKNAVQISNEKGLKALEGSLENVYKYDAISFSSSIDNLAFSYAKAEMKDADTINVVEDFDAKITNAESKVAVSGLTSATSLNEMSASYTERATIEAHHNGENLFSQDSLEIGYGIYLEESKGYFDFSNEAVRQILTMIGSENQNLPEQFYVDVALPSDSNVAFPLFSEEFFTQTETAISEALAPYLDEEALASIKSVGETLANEFITFSEYDNKYALVFEVTLDKIMNVVDAMAEGQEESVSTDTSYIKQTIRTALSGFDHIKFLLEFSSTGFLRAAASAKFNLSIQSDFTSDEAGNVTITSTGIGLEMAMSCKMAYGSEVVVEKAANKENYQKMELPKEEGM